MVLGGNVKECVNRLLKEGYHPSLEGWESSDFKSDASKLGEHSMLNIDKVISDVESKVVKNHRDDINIDEFTCPITQCIMEEPVMTNCGHSFESWAIRQHIEYNMGKAPCPKCRDPIQEDKLTLNYSLRDAIELEQKKVQISSLVPSLKNLFKGKNNEDLAQPLLKQAKIHLEKKEYNEALSLNMNAIKYCNKSEYYTNIPLIFEKQKEQAKACLAYLYLSTYQKDFAESLQSLQKAFKLDSNFPELAFLIAQTFKRIEKNEEAVYFYRKAAEVFLRKDEKKQAIKCYQEAIFIKPDSMELYDNLASLYDDNKQKAHIYLKGALYFISKNLSKEAESLCSKAREYCSEDYLIQQPYLDLLEQDERLDELTKNCYELGKIFEKKNADKEAIACYEKIIRVYNSAGRNSARIYRDLISVVRRSETKERLLSKYLEWIAVCIKAKDWKESEEITNEAILVIGEDSQLLKKLKKIYGLTKSVKLEPVLLRLGEAYEKETKFEKAQKVYKVAWDAFQNIKACFSLTSLLSEKDASIEALEIYKKLAERLYLNGDMQNLNKCVSKMIGLDVNLINFNQQEKMAFLAQKYASDLFLKVNVLQTDLSHAKEQLRYNSNIIATITSDIKPIKTLQEHTGDVWTLKMLPYDQLASGSFDKTIKIWDLNNFQCVGNLIGHKAEVRCVELLPNGLLASGSIDSAIKIWDLRTFTCKKTLDDHVGSVQGLLPLSFNRLASVSGDKTVKIWDLNNFKCVKTLEGHSSHIWSIELLSDGLFATSSADCTIKIWDLDSYGCVRTLKGHAENVTTLQFSPHKNNLFSGSWDNTIKIWDLNNFKCVKTLEGHTNVVRELKLLSKELLASASDDKTIKIWDLTKGVCIKTLEGPNKVYALELLENGQLVSGSSDKTIKIWNLPRYE